MFQKYILLFFFFIISLYAFAQQELHCGTDEMRISTLRGNSQIAKAVVERDNELENFTREFIVNKMQRESTADSALYVIPVVFHIIHNYGNENISNEQVYDALDVLNKTFRKQRVDTADIVEVFKPIHADTEIEFHLAKKDPNGNCHSGINRIASYYSETGGHEVKTLVQWNPANHLNVYVVKNAAGLAGHAIFPSDADTIPAWDGIVISHNYVGSIGTSNPQRSVVLAHECGHYLNLQHIWGGNNVPGYYFLPCADTNHDCINIDDGVDDTPRTIGWQSCNLSGASCNNAVDNVQNVMDYSYCNIMFTAGQRDRMQAALNSSIGNRNNLWQPTNLISAGIYDAPLLCAADFSSDKKVVCPGGTVTFRNESYQPPFDSVLWTFEGGTPATSSDAEPEINYNSAGAYDVSLMVYSGNDSVSVSKSNFFSVLPENNPVGFPFSEDFAIANSLDEINWIENSFDEENRWEITDSVGYFSFQSVMLNNFNNTVDTKDELYSPLIDLSQASTNYFHFSYAFAGKTAEINDQLLLQFNKGCSNFWLTKLTIDSAELETSNPQNTPFFPPSTNEWKDIVTEVPSSYFVDDFRFRFVFNSRGGNNLFIGYTYVEPPENVNEKFLTEKRMKLFPNPATEEINIVLPQNAGKIKEVQVMDAKASPLTPLQMERGTVNVSQLSAGLYFLLVETEKEIYRQRFVKY